MQTKKQVAIVLGGTAPHAELCNLLKKRGYYTILVDYLDNPPASLVADEHIRESTLDNEKVFEIAIEREADLVISTCIDQANVTACDVLERLGKHAPYSYATALQLSNKISMKSIMIDNEIPTSRFCCVSDLFSAKFEHLRFPVVVKPSDSNGSKGVRRCDTISDALRNLPAALALSRSKQAIVEEFIEGREIAFDSYLIDDKLNILMTRERRKINSGFDDIQQIYGSFWPADVSLEIHQKLVDIGESIARAFNLRNTPLMVQAIVRDGEVSVIEFAPRIGGGENHRIIKMATGFDPIRAAIESFLGARTTIEMEQPTKVYLDFYLYAKNIIFGRVEGLEEAKINGIVDEYSIYKAKGDVIGSELTSGNRIGSFIVSAEDQNKGLSKIENALRNIEIYDSNGNHIKLDCQ